MTPNRHARAAGLCLAATALLTGCAGSTGPATPFPSLAADAVIITAKGTQFTTQSVHVVADRPWTLAFDNQDGLPHNVVIIDGNNTTVFTGAIVNGPTLKLEPVPALPAGEYHFTCIVHPEMHGALSVP